MLRLNDIKKDYYVGDMTVNALKGVNLSFRKNEFVSILGPSGCGKTTLLNIIGGLDKYTSGDLFIAGRSTKNFNDHDWDVYRNHRIGFIFQSYNLIPHQNVLSNVELALTISGISKNERVERAKKALDRVGLTEQYYKKPNQLSGGQCQRVAIARALVNEPEILLADEPTGALDTETSIQIMEIIKEIASERLVIMVTHNPDLAYKYSTRIVKFLDGLVVEDSNPFTEDEEIAEIKDLEAKGALDIEAKINREHIESVEAEFVDNNKKKKKNKERAKMSFFTAFKLSAKNLYSKFKRTIMIVVAGSIGIIGVSSVLSVSTGVRDYIGSIQDDLLSGNPITISKTGVDYETIMNSASTVQKVEALKKGDWVNVSSIINYLVSNEEALQELVFNNDFNMNYINYIKSMPKEYYQDIRLNYGLEVTPNIFTEFKVRNQKEDLNTGMVSLHSITETYTAILEKTPYKEYSQYITALATPMSQGITNTDYIKTQYDVLAGDLSTFGKEESPNDIIVVLDQNEALSDLLLAQLGYYTEEEFLNMIWKAAPDKMNNAELYNKDLDKINFPYDEILNKEFYYYPNDLVYLDNSANATNMAKSLGMDYDFVHQYDYQYSDNEMINKQLELALADKKVRTQDTNATLTEEEKAEVKTKVLNDINSKKITMRVKAIVRPKENVSYGSLKSGFLYSEAFARNAVKMNYDSAIAKNIREHGSISSLSYSGFSVGISYNLNYTYYEYENSNIDEAYKHDKKTIYVGKNNSGILNTAMAYLSSGISSGYSGGGSGGSNTSDFSNALANLKTMDLNGVAGTYIPENIKIYPNDFNNKYLVTDYLNAWNNKEKTITVNEYNADFTAINKTYEIAPDDRAKIKYTDNVELIINIINQLINIVTYALIAFTALSLVVSTVMVGIITYVSVVERVKEIGVIRSLGGRKKDVSHLFNAETFMIGLASGVFGVLVTGLLSLLVNVIVKYASGGQVVSIAHLTWANALIMIALSITLTLIAGLIPARSAANKNPVDALRTE